jgi:hypothetical protein
MRTRTGPWAAVAIASVGIVAAAARAQSSTAPTDNNTTNLTAEQRLERLERRMDEEDRKHEAELRARDEQIAKLKEQLSSQPTTAPASTSATTAATDDIEKTKQDVLKDIESKEQPAQTQRTPVSFNPDIAVVTDFRPQFSTNNDNPARNRIDVGSVELDMRAAVAPIADGVAVIPISRDVDDPLFPLNTPNPDPGPHTNIDIEEAYVLLHDFGVPNLTAKLGRFHLRFGRQNILHSHDWPTFDNNFVNQSFLGSESLNDAGLSLSYIVPPKLIGDQYVELIGELISGEGNGEDGPVINNTALFHYPGFNGHALWNHDIAKDWNIEVGGSFLAGHRDNSRDQTAFLYGGDVTLIHTDPTGKFNNQLFMLEAIYGDVDTSPTITQHSFGAYALAQQQINRDWYTGVRLDWTEDALDDRREVWGISPYITWYYFEFLRFRFEYQYKAGDVPTENNFFTQVTWIFGAHPPHPYWAMR